MLEKCRNETYNANDRRLVLFITAVFFSDEVVTFDENYVYRFAFICNLLGEIQKSLPNSLFSECELCGGSACEYSISAHLRALDCKNVRIL
jgi:hypothetical protein